MNRMQKITAATVSTRETIGIPFWLILRKTGGMRWSRLMARGYRDELMIPAFATDMNAKSAAMVTSTRPVVPANERAASPTGVRLFASSSAGVTPTMTMRPTM